MKLQTATYVLDYSGTVGGLNEVHMVGVHACVVWGPRRQPPPSQPSCMSMSMAWPGWCHLIWHHLPFTQSIPHIQHRHGTWNACIAKHRRRLWLSFSIKTSDLIVFVSRTQKDACHTLRSTNITLSMHACAHGGFNHQRPVSCMLGVRPASSAL
jgi:hypothetical protein